MKHWGPCKTGCNDSKRATSVVVSTLLRAEKNRAQEGATPVDLVHERATSQIQGKLKEAA